MALGIGSWFKDEVVKPVEEGVKDVIEHPWEAAAAVATVTTGLPVGMAIMSAGEQQQAAEEAVKAGERGAEMERERTLEQSRVMKEENARTDAVARARAASSGLSGASSELYIESLAASGREDILWLEKVGQSAYNARLEEGQSAYRTAMSNMWGSLGTAGSEGIKSAERFDI